LVYTPAYRKMSSTSITVTVQFRLPLNLYIFQSVVAGILITLCVLSLALGHDITPLPTILLTLPILILAHLRMPPPLESSKINVFLAFLSLIYSVFSLWMFVFVLWIPLIPIGGDGGNGRVDVFWDVVLYECRFAGVLVLFMTVLGTAMIEEQRESKDRLAEGLRDRESSVEGRPRMRDRESSTEGRRRMRGEELLREYEAKRERERESERVRVAEEEGERRPLLGGRD